MLDELEGKRSPQAPISGTGSMCLPIDALNEAIWALLTSRPDCAELEWLEGAELAGVGIAGRPSPLKGRFRPPGPIKSATSRSSSGVLFSRFERFRLRALFGVGARADIIGAVLSRRSEDFGAADLVFIGYSKRNLAEALDMLAAAGLFRTTRTGNRVRFSWQRREELSALLAPLPDVIPVWSSTLRVMSGFLDLLTRMQAKSDRLVAVEAARCLRQLVSDLQALGVEPPDLPAMTRDALSDWVLSTSMLLVRAGSSSSSTEASGRRRKRSSSR